MYIVDISRKTYERNGVETLRDNDGEKIQKNKQIDRRIVRS